MSLSAKSDYLRRNNFTLVNMSTKNELYHRIASTTKAPRSIMIEYVRAVAAEAYGLPASKLLARSGESQFRDPQEPGEVLAAGLFHALVMQDDLSSDLQNICDIAQELQANIDNKELWGEFFEASQELE